MKININKMAGTIFYSMLKAEYEVQAKNAYVNIQQQRKLRDYYDDLNEVPRFI